MKLIDDYTHYETLEVRPNASFFDIREAYKEILSIYDAESLSTYSLFTPLERKNILAEVETAFQILSDTEKRNTYDKSLIASGRLTPEMLIPDKTRTPVPVFHTDLPKNCHSDKRIKEKINEKQVRVLIEKIQSKGIISGQDLKSIRTAAKINLMDIFEASRISVNILEAIEENFKHQLPAPIYLKGFLKSYAEFLGLIPEKIISGYMEYLSHS